MTTKTITREQWLNKIVAKSRPMFKKAGHELPIVRVAIGVTQTKKAIGECWHSICAEDKAREIWVSPTINHQDPMRIADVLIHELCHAALPDNAGHKTQFARLAKAMLLIGKPSATEASEEFAEVWAPILEKIGPYPGVGNFARGAIIGGRKKQKAYLIKCQCLECEAVWRMTQTHIEAVQGSMKCPCCGETEVVIGDV